MEAAGGIARNLGGGIAAMGQGLAGAIEKYKANKDESEFLDQKFQMSAAVIDKFKNNQAAAQDPQIQKLIEGVGQFSSFSTSKKKAFLNDAEFTISKFEKEEQKTYQRDQDEQRMALERQRALFDANRLNNENAMTTARINEMGKIFTPSASLLTLPDGTKIPMVMTGPNSAQPVIPKAAPGPESPLGKLMSDRDAAITANKPSDAEAFQKQINNEVKRSAEGAGAKALTAEQSNALNFALRLKQNERFIATNKFDATAFWNGSYKPERFKKDDQKSYESAKNNWIAAALRKESGAAIAESEYKNFDRQYFPQAGDGEKVLKQKLDMRNQVALAMVYSIGPEAPQYMIAAKLPEDGTNAAQLPGKPSGPKQFKTMQEAEDFRASLQPGQLVEVEIYDPATNKYRRARITR